MARRFKRSNFLFPLDLNAARGDVSARPVDPFVRADEGTIEQAPQRPFEPNRPEQDNKLIQLARSLGVATDTATNIGTQQYKEYTERATAAGASLALQDERRGNKQGFKQLVSKTRVDSGEEAARDLMGMNPYVKKGFDQTRARTAALSFNASLQAEYASNPLLSKETGVRLHDVDVESPEYTRWRNDFQNRFNAENDIAGLDPEAQAQIVPAIQDADNRVNLAHSELRSALKLQAFENESAEFVSTAIFDLNGNAEYQAGTDTQAPLLAAELITAQLDEANDLGYGGDDLKNLYKQIVGTIINGASITENAELLDVLEFIEVGPEDNRQLLLNTAIGQELRPAVESAKQNIVDRVYQEGQRERTVRDQTKEDKRNETFEAIAVVSGLYDATGRTPQGYQVLQDTITAGRATAAEFGFTVDYNAAVTQITQDAVDNQGVNIIDYGALGRLEGSIDNGMLGGETAQRQLRDMLINGQLGNGKDSYTNYLRLNEKIKASSDKSQASFSNNVEKAAATYRDVVIQRLGFTEDERGRQVSLKQALNADGITDQMIQTVVNMNITEAEAYIAQRRITAINGGMPFSETTASAINTIVTEGLNPLNMPQAIDPGAIEQQTIEFKNKLYREKSAFEEREGRPMTPQEEVDFVNGNLDSQITGQRYELPGSNPLSSRRKPGTAREMQMSDFYNEFFDGLGDKKGDPRKAQLMDGAQMFKAFESFSATGIWHPEIQALADANNMTPMQLLQSQATVSGAEIDPDLFINIGLPQPAKSSDVLPGTSVYSRNGNISKSYSPGNYQVSYNRGWPGEAGHGGSFDFTFIQNGRYDVNIPAPFDGVVVGTINDPGGYGNNIVIKERSTGQQMILAHAEAVYLKKGDRFVKGQALLKQGSTGRSTGEHLHVEIWDRNGNKVTNTDYTTPILKQWVSEVQSGYFLPSQQAPRAGQGGGSWKTPKNPALGQTIANSASRLGVSPSELASVLALESTLDINSRGGDKDSNGVGMYVGLWQAGPDAQAKYGVYQGMPAGQQMAALESYLRDVGYRPGMGITALYASILAGDPYDIRSADSNTTTAAGAAAMFKPGGQHYKTAQAVLGF